MDRESLVAKSEPPAVCAPSLDAIFEAESSYVWNSLRRLGVPSCDLEDITHDVFLVVHRLLPQYDARRPLRPWLFGIAYREASNYRRKAQHVREVSAFAEAVDETPAVDEKLEAAQARELVLSALETLELDRRAVLVMHDLDGQTMPEIAEALAIPLNTAYSRLRLARAQFAAAVKRSARRREIS